MSDDEPNEQSSEDSEQAGQQPANDSDQPAEQSEEQPAESDQPTEQSEEQAAADDQTTEPSEEQASDSDQPAEQSEEQPAESDQPADEQQPAEQAEEQPADSDQSAASASADNTLAFAGGAAAPGGGPADDAVAAGTGGKLQVKAEFTQEGDQVFAGEIKIDVFEYDEKGVTKAFGAGSGVWRETREKDNKITTPFIPVTTSRVAIQANARISIIDSASGDLHVSQVIGETFVFRMPIPNNVLVAGFDVEVKALDQSIPAPDAEEALKRVKNVLRGSTLLFQKVEKIGNQRFRVTGKYYSGHISIRHTNVQPV